MWNHTFFRVFTWPVIAFQLGHASRAPKITCRTPKLDALHIARG